MSDDKSNRLGKLVPVNEEPVSEPTNVPPVDQTNLDVAATILGAELTELEILDKDTFANICRQEKCGGELPLILEALLKSKSITRFQAEKISQTGSADAIRFDDYVLLDKLGEGGMGEVFKARNLLLGRLEAIKTILLTDDRQDTLSKRFQQEARLLARLEHPCITPIYKVGKYRNVDFIAMKYIQGEDLKAKVGKAKKNKAMVDFHEACEWILEAASGLHHAHAQSVIHRDIKPSNIMVTSENRVYVLDMGIARLADPSGSKIQNLTVNRRGLGTPEYMPPEQWADATSVTPASDIYALGCTFYYVLTGQVPYRRPAITDLMRAHMNDVIPKPTALRPDLPKEVDGIIARMLAKKPTDRYASAQDFINALKPVLHQSPAADKTSIPRTMRTVPLVRVKEGPSTAVAVAILGLVFVATLAIGYAIIQNRSNTTTKEPAKNSDIAKTESATKSSAALPKSTTESKTKEPPTSAVVVEKTAKAPPEVQQPAKTVTPMKTVRQFVREYREKYSKEWPNESGLLAFVQKQNLAPDQPFDENVAKLFDPAGVVGQKTVSNRLQITRLEIIDATMRKHQAVWPDRNELESFAEAIPIRTADDLANFEQRLEQESRALARPFADLTVEPEDQQWMKVATAELANILSIHALPIDATFGLQSTAINEEGFPVKAISPGQKIWFAFRFKKDCAITMVQFDKWGFFAVNIDSADIEQKKFDPQSGTTSFRYKEGFSFRSPGKRTFVFYAFDQDFLKNNVEPKAFDEPIFAKAFGKHELVLNRLERSLRDGIPMPGIAPPPTRVAWDRAVVELEVKR